MGAGGDAGGHPEISPTVYGFAGTGASIPAAGWRPTSAIPASSRGRIAGLRALRPSSATPGVAPVAPLRSPSPPATRVFGSASAAAAAAAAAAASRPLRSIDYAPAIYGRGAVRPSRQPTVAHWPPPRWPVDDGTVVDDDDDDGSDGSGVEVVSSASSGGRSPKRWGSSYGRPASAAGPWRPPRACVVLLLGAAPPAASALSWLVCAARDAGFAVVPATVPARPPSRQFAPVTPSPVAIAAAACAAALRRCKRVAVPATAFGRPGATISAVEALSAAGAHVTHVIAIAGETLSASALAVLERYAAKGRSSHVTVTGGSVTALKANAARALEGIVGGQPALAAVFVPTSSRVTSRAHPSSDEAIGRAEIEAEDAAHAATRAATVAVAVTAVVVTAPVVTAPPVAPHPTIPVVHEAGDANHDVQRGRDVDVEQQQSRAADAAARERRPSAAADIRLGPAPDPDDDVPDVISPEVPPRAAARLKAALATAADAEAKAETAAKERDELAAMNAALAANLTAEKAAQAVEKAATAAQVEQFKAVIASLETNIDVATDDARSAADRAAAALEAATLEAAEEKRRLVDAAAADVLRLMADQAAALAAAQRRVDEAEAGRQEAINAHELKLIEDKYDDQLAVNAAEAEEEKIRAAEADAEANRVWREREAAVVIEEQERQAKEEARRRAAEAVEAERVAWRGRVSRAEATMQQTARIAADSRREADAAARACNGTQASLSLLRQVRADLKAVRGAHNERTSVSNSKLKDISDKWAEAGYDMKWPLRRGKAKIQKCLVNDLLSIERNLQGSPAARQAAASAAAAAERAAHDAQNAESELQRVQAAAKAAGQEAEAAAGPSAPAIARPFVGGYGGRTLRSNELMILSVAIRQSVSRHKPALLRAGRVYTYTYAEDLPVSDRHLLLSQGPRIPVGSLIAATMGPSRSSGNVPRPASILGNLSVDHLIEVQLFRQAILLCCSLGSPLFNAFVDWCEDIAAVQFVNLQGIPSNANGLLYILGEGPATVGDLITPIQALLNGLTNLKVMVHTYNERKGRVVTRLANNFGVDGTTGALTSKYSRSFLKERLLDEITRPGVRTELAITGADATLFAGMIVEDLDAAMVAAADALDKYMCRLPAGRAQLVEGAMKMLARAFRDIRKATIGQA